MFARDQIVSEYFDLRIKLNRSNKQPNEKTEIKFSIVGHKKISYFFAQLGHGTDAPRIELCHKLDRSIWRPSALSEFANLEDYCAERLQYYERAKNAALVQNVEADLRSLGISKD